MVGCKALPKRKLHKLESIVRAYQRHNRPHALDEINFFRKMPSLDDTIRSAGTATDWREKRFDHQRRLPGAVLRSGTIALRRCKNQIAAASSFHELHEILRCICNRIAGLGELYAYDTALRIGSYLGFEPEGVYLHAGTRVGARALGMDTKRPYIPVDELPGPLRALPAHELEDLLCIYKSQLRKFAASR